LTGCSSLTFLLLITLVVDAGETGLFCCGDWRITGFSSISLSSILVLFEVIGPISTIFYIKKKNI